MFWRQSFSTFSLSSSVSPSLSFSLSLLCHSLSPFSVSPVSPRLSLSLSLLSLSVSLSLFLYIFFSIGISLISLSHTHTHTLSLSLSLSVSLSPYSSLTLSFYLSFFLCLSLSHIHTHTHTHTRILTSGPLWGTWLWGISVRSPCGPLLVGYVQPGDNNPAAYDVTIKKCASFSTRSQNVIYGVPLLMPRRA